MNTKKYYIKNKYISTKIWIYISPQKLIIRSLFNLVHTNLRLLSRLVETKGRLRTKLKEKTKREMKSNKNASQETSKPELSLGPQKHGSA